MAEPHPARKPLSEASPLANAWIGLGSNQGDRLKNLEEAQTALRCLPRTTLVATSSWHMTRPVGGPPGQGDYLNAVAGLATTLEPEELLAELQQIEQASGRVRGLRWAERPLDLDLLLYDGVVSASTHLILPHPRMAFRRFVLSPFAEIAPWVRHPTTGMTIDALLAHIDRRPWTVALTGPDSPLKQSVYQSLLAHGFAPGQARPFAEKASPAPDRSSLTTWYLAASVGEAHATPTFAVVIDPDRTATSPVAIRPYPQLVPTTLDVATILTETLAARSGVQPDPLTTPTDHPIPHT